MASNLVAESSDLSFYLHDLKSLVGGEPWNEIEAYAERLWRNTRSAQDPDWQGIREHVLSRWNVPARIA